MIGKLGTRMLALFKDIFWGVFIENAKKNVLF